MLRVTFVSVVPVMFVITGVAVVVVVVVVVGVVVGLMTGTVVAEVNVVRSVRKVAVRVPVIKVGTVSVRAAPFISSRMFRQTNYRVVTLESVRNADPVKPVIRLLRVLSVALVLSVILERNASRSSAVLSNIDDAVLVVKDAQLSVMLIQPR